MESVKKGADTRRKNKEGDPDYYSIPPLERELCNICNKEITIKYAKRHALFCKPKGLPRECSNCGAFGITKRHKCSRYIKNTGEFKCETCGKIFKKRKFFEMHVSNCTIKENIVRKIETFECDVCGEVFKSERARQTHLKNPRSHMSKEEKKAERSRKFKETMNSKSPEEKELIGKKISERVSAARNNRSDEEKANISEITRQAMLEFYNSPNYDSEKRSEQIKNGLCKNKEYNRD